MLDRPTIFTCEECKQPVFEVCPQCDGEGRCEYSAMGCSTTQEQAVWWDTCDHCWGSGWSDKDCACATPRAIQGRYLTAEEILARYRKHKETA